MFQLLNVCCTICFKTHIHSAHTHTRARAHAQTHTHMRTHTESNQLTWIRSESYRRQAVRVSPEIPAYLHDYLHSNAFAMLEEHNPSHIDKEWEFAQASRLTGMSVWTQMHLPSLTSIKLQKNRKPTMPSWYGKAASRAPFNTPMLSFSDNKFFSPKSAKMLRANIIISYSPWLSTKLYTHKHPNFEHKMLPQTIRIQSSTYRIINYPFRLNSCCPKAGSAAWAVRRCKLSLLYKARGGRKL